MTEPRARGPERPLSPHWQIYRWPVSMVISILHRFTGLGLAVGTLVLAWWLVAAALGPQPYAIFEAVAYHWFGRLVLFGFTVALVFHMLNGIRHLFWDIGVGLTVPSANRSGIAVYVLTIVLTWVIWVLAYHAMGKL